MAGDVGDGATGVDPGRFERWLAELRVDDAARHRARRHWLRAAAEEDASLAGVLLDLAERGDGVAVGTTTGRRHHGRIVALGGDLLVLATAAGRLVALRHDSVTTVRSADGPAGLVGHRSGPGGHRFVDVLVALAGERLDATLVLVDGDSLTGELRSVGRDVVVVRADGDPPVTAYVALDAVVELGFAGPG